MTHRKASLVVLISVIALFVCIIGCVGGGGSDNPLAALAAGLGGTPPGKATNPVPADAGQNVATTQVLGWTAGTNASAYNVYFVLGTTISSSAIPSSAAQTGLSFTPSAAMTAGAQYTWRVDSISSGGAITTGDTWTFTVTQGTAGKATNPTPADNQASVSATTSLSWTAATGASSYNVYLVAGSSTTSASASSSGQTGVTFTPSAALTAGGTYTWRVDSVDSSSFITTGDEWSFTVATAPTASDKATNVSPAHQSTGITLTTTLDWAAPASGNAQSYDVYLATQSTYATNGNTLLIANRVAAGVTTLTHTPSAALAGTTKYFWRVDTNTSTTTVTGDTWEFDTLTPNTVPINPSPADAGTSTTQYPILSWTGVTGATGYDVWFGTTSGSLTKIANSTTSTYLELPSANPVQSIPLTASTTYFWEVLLTGTTPTGTEWSFTTGTETPSTRVSGHSPADLSTGAAVGGSLSWTALTGATGYDVWLGTSATFTVSNKVSSNQSGTTFTPSSPLTPNTQYFWRVDAITANWKSQGNTVSFTTSNAQITGMSPPTQDTIHALYGLSATNVVAVGENATLSVWNGTNWQVPATPPPVTGTPHFRAMNHFVVNKPLIAGGGTYTEFFGSGDAGVIFAGSSTGTSGTTTWQGIASGVTANIYDVWIENPTPAATQFAPGVPSIYAVGDAGTVLEIRVNATAVPPTFTAPQQTLPSAVATIDYRGVSGFSPTDVWAVGKSSTVVHGTGTSGALTWTQITVPGATSDFNDVWCDPTSGEIFIAGTDEFWHTTVTGGTPGTWVNKYTSQVTSGVPETLDEIWVNSNTDVWVVGKAVTTATSASISVINWFSGTAWTRQTHPTVEHLDAIWADGTSTVFVGGHLGHVMQFNVGTQLWSSSASPVVDHLRGIYAPNNTLIYSVGENGTIVKGSLSTSWAYTTETSGTTNTLRGIDGDSTGSNMYAVGDSGTALYSTGTGSWAAPTGFPSGITANLNAISGTSPNDVVIVGDGGTLIRMTGGTWTDDTISAGTPPDFKGVYEVSSTSAYAVGTGGKIYHYNGTGWSAMTQSVTTSDLYSVHGTSDTDVWACGNAGVILHYNGTAWSASTSGVTSDLRAIKAWSATQVYATGPGALSPQAPVLIEYTGTSWSAAGATPASNGFDLACTATNALFGCGPFGTIWKFTK
ncbi:MAG: hypothetical protein NUW37_10825 [Planctomycetes bacterium]|nr:hypothetical protein [Planctomycetota bacterium]